MNFGEFLIGWMALGLLALLIIFAVTNIGWFIAFVIIAIWIVIIYRSVYKKE